MAEGVNFDALAVGEIVVEDVQLLETESGHPYEKRVVTVGDESDPLEANKLNMMFDMWNKLIEDHIEDFPIPTMKNGYQKNVAYDWFYKFEEPEFDGTMEEWGELGISAKALYAMQVLDNIERVFKSGKVTDRARNILTNSMDAIGIRTRARIMKSIVTKNAEESTETNVKLVSLGAGAAVPAINAVLEIEETLGKKVNMGLYDKDGDILEFAEESVANAGIPEDQLETHEGDYYDAFELPPESVSILEALGLFEYLHNSRCERLIKEAYELLKPGGVMVFSNMLSSRSQLAFHQRAVAWPGVKPRSEEELINMVAKAGIDTRLVTLTVSQDGVYAVVEIHKP